MPFSSPVAALTKGALAYGFAGMLTRAANLILLPIYTAYLAPAEYGMLSLFVVLAAVIVPVASMGLGVSIGLVYFEGNELRYQAQVIWSAFAVLCVTGLVVAAPLIVQASLVSDLMFGQSDHALLVVIATISTWLTIVGQPFTTHLQLDRRLSAYLFCSVGTSIILVGASFWLAIELQRGVRGVLEAQVLSQLFSTLALAGTTWLRLSPGFSLKLARHLARHGAPLIPAFAILFVLQQTPQAMLRAIDGLESLGIYAVGAALGAAMSILVSGFTSAWPSIFLPYGNQPDNARDVIRRISSLYVLGMGAVSLLFFVWAQPVVYLLTAAPFHKAYVVVGLSACAQTIWGYFSILLPAAYFAKEVGIVNVTQGISAVLFLPVCWLLILWSPVLGAGFSLVAAGALLVAVQHTWNRLRGRRYLQVDYAWKQLLPFGVFYVLVAAGFTLPNQLGLPLSIMFSLAGTITVLLTAYFQLPIKDRHQIWNILRPATKR